MDEKERYLDMIERRLSLLDENDLRIIYNFMLGMERGTKDGH